MIPEFAQRLREDQACVEEYLASLFVEPGHAYLNEAMRYSLLAGGKRIRPVLTLAFCRLFGGATEVALQAGAAVEMVHTYSLIHDDLPCMDNDDLRRGKPTSHRIYGEAGAVLAGDALLTEAFRQLAELSAPAACRIALVRVLAQCAGARGMVAGQVLDLKAEQEPADAEGVQRIQSLKTGALIRAACQMGALCADADEQALAAAAAYAEHLGLAFQICDDLLDAEGNAEKLGKATGVDARKSTFLSIYGSEWCRARVAAETAAAQQALAAYPDAAFLCAFAEELAVRDH